MSKHKYSRNNIQFWFKRIIKYFRYLSRSIVKSLLRLFKVRNRSPRFANAGFVLPTVTMVLLVVVLLTIAIMLRSFNRVDTARNVKVSAQALSAATPALDRARAKIQYLLQEDPTLPRETPSDDVLYSTLSFVSPTGDDTYTFADEARLSVTFDLDDPKGIQPLGPNDTGQIEDDEEITTAWRFPVDTDNNGVSDSYTIYGIFFRTPPRNGTSFDRERKPLEARTPPMPPLGVLQNQDCAGALGSSASLVGDSGWYKADGKLVKSFFVYTVTVPITQPNQNQNEEAFKGTTGIAALEYQEDWERIPLTNNAVVYQDDLEISPGPDFRINGRILTNSNLVVSPFGNTLRIYQVSGNNSCFYEAENSKIIVGGNVVNGMSGNNTQRNNVDVDLFQSTANPVITNQKISTTNQSIDQDAFATIYNNDAYEQRIAALVNDQATQPETDDHPEITAKVNLRMEEEGATDPDRRAEIRREEIEIYFRDRTRKVPFAEVPANGSVNPLVSSGNIPEGSGNSLRPPDDWMFPTNGDALVGTANGPTNLTLRLAQLQATEPDPEDPNRPEQYLGDRILVGNNLPAKRWDDAQNTFLADETQQVNGTQTWTDPNTVIRTRRTRVTELPNVGSTNRNGFWERTAARLPEAALDGIGGLRVVTGSGVYERTNSFLPPPRTDDPGTTGIDEALYDDPATTTVTEEYPVVWPDTMPMSPGPGTQVYDNTSAAWVNLPDTSSTSPTWPLNTTDFPAQTPSIDPNTPQYAKGDLRMRATVLYHYAQDPIDPNVDPVDNEQTPIACISSYYDPTDSITAANLLPLPPDPEFGATANGKSNNGVVYPPPTDNFRPTSASLDTSTGLFTTNPVQLGQQANLVFPDGRFANEPLRRALNRLDGGTADDLTLEEQAAIDSALCSLDILAGTLTPTTTPTAGVTIAHGVIREVTLLDGRQIKAIDADDPATTNVDETFTLDSDLANPANLTTNYDLAIEERQPLEIRLTQLDLDAMRKQAIDFDASVTTGPSPEYLLPNSGIIYATRDDALRDRSDRTPNTAIDAIDEDSSKLISPTDYQLDPTRRPNGIMLINGQLLARNDDDNNGQNDDGVSTVNDVVKEKGLTLVSNLPVYIQGVFNPHTQQEFNNTLNNDWGNFYGRTGINQNFACRPGDPRISGCDTGDQWRPATVLADAITLLSDNPTDLDRGFRLGFRNEGDFDLRNNGGNLAAVVDDFNADGIADAGYDFDLDGSLGSSLGLDETAASQDLNGDGDQTDIDEGVLGFDLDGDGVITDAALPEANITVAGARRLNGFYANNFVSNGLSSAAFNVNGTTVNRVTYNTSGTASSTPVTDNNYSTTNGNAVNSSYFNNYVTPVQRRGNFPQYVMEICRKLPVSSCQPEDWVVGYDFDGDGLLNTTESTLGQDVNRDSDTTDTERDVRASDLIATGSPSNINFLGAGTTARPALDPNDRRYPRRVAFLRYPSDDTGTTSVNEQNLLVLDANNVAIPLGINAGNVNYYPYSAVTLPIDGSSNQFDIGGTATSFTAGVPQTAANALWFKTTTTPATPTGGDNYGNGNSNYLFYLNPLVATDPAAAPLVGTIQQPQLVPVLQNYVSTGAPPGNSANLPNPNTNQLVNNARWLPQAAGDTTFNLTVGSGDVPPRTGTNNGETNGGLQNLPRFLENWSRNGDQNTTIIGGFMQLNRSAYATAPYVQIPPNAINPQIGANSIFNYSGIYNISPNRIPFFLPPSRNWGFDVGLLSQSPDYFSQQLSGQSSNAEPDKYYRELSQDDEWIQTLLCSRVVNTGDNAVNDDNRPTQFCTDFTE